MPDQEKDINNSDPTEDSDGSQHEESDVSSDDNTDLPEIDRYWPPPRTESVRISGSYTSKTITAFAFNNSGTRFAAGGHDHEVRIWDFEAIDISRPESICNSQPCGQTVIKNLDYSIDDELVLVISGSCQAAIVAKDGIITKYQCPKGDQYISDMSKTKGHVQMLNYGRWNPKDNETFITCSNDCTIRIWDLKNLSQQKTVIKTRSPMSGLKAVPTVCRYTSNALSIVAGCNDGSIMLWDTRRKFISTSALIKNAHLKGNEITGLDFSYGLNQICTRSEDESCKMWDFRKLKEPIAVKTGLVTLYSNIDCSFSPDDQLIITGYSKTKLEPGGMVFLDASTLETKEDMSIEEASVIRCKWHPKINHIGYTCSNGVVYITYDNAQSIGGFLSVCLGRGTKRKKYISHMYNSDPTQINKIITPHALPLFRDDQSSASFAKIRQDPKRSYKPEVPVMGASQGGRVKPAGSTLSSYIAKNIAKPVDDEGKDIRERILRHADEAKQGPSWI